MQSRASTLVMEDLERRLASLRAGLKRTTLAGGLSATFVTAGTALALAFCLDSFWNLPRAVRIALLVGSAAAVAVTAVRRLVIPLSRRIDRRTLAALVESSHPEMEERLLSVLELSDPNVAESEKGSPLMREWLYRQTAASTHGFDFDDVVDSRPAFRRACIAAASIVVLAAPFLIWQEGYGTLWARFFNPWGNYARGANLVFEVQPGDRTVPRGEDVTITAAPHFRVGAAKRPSEAVLIWSDEEGDSDERLLRWDDKIGSFVAVLPQVLHGFRYQIETGSGSSREYEIKVVDRPEIVGLTLDIQPPAYCGRPAERIDGVVGETRIFERSRLKFQATFNRPVAQAGWIWLDEIRQKYDGKSSKDRPEATLVSDVLPGVMFAPEDLLPLTLAADGRSAEWDMVADRGGAFELVLLDATGIQNRREPARSLRLIADTAPTIAWTDGGGHPQARTDDVLTFGVAATDDIALAAVELHYSVLPTRVVKNVIKADGGLLGRRDFQQTFQFDLRPLLLPEGTLVGVKARATDERDVPGPNEAWTSERIIVITKEAQPYGADQLAERHQRVRESLKELRKEATVRENAVGDLKEKFREAQSKGEAFDLAAAADEQRPMQERLTQGVEQLSAQLSQDGLLASLAPILNEVADNDVKPAIEQMDQSKSTADGEKPQKLEQAQNELREADQHLGQAEQKFEELAKLEKDLLELNRLADRTDRLADDVGSFEQRQNEMAARDPMQPNSQDDQRQLENQREKLQEDQRQLTQNLQDLLNRRPELVEAARADLFDRLKELADRANRIAEKEDLLAEAMRDAANENAESLQQPAENQQSLLEEIEKLAAENELQQGRTVTPPFDLAAAQEALKNLQNGNPQAAADAQENAAKDLEKLAEALARNETLPTDPQAATRELMQRQQAVKDRLQQAAEAAQQAQEKQGFDPEAAEQPLKEELKEVATEQAAIQAAAANLDVPQPSSWRQKEAVNNANESLRNLLANAPQQAAEAAERARQSLEQLANELGNPEERQRKTVEEARNLRNMQEGLANHLDHLRNQDTNGEQSADQLKPQIEQQANPQAEIARRVADLEVPQAAEAQRTAVREAARSLAAIQSQNPQDAAAAAQAAQRALAELQRKLEGKPSANEEVEQLRKKQQEISESSRQALQSGKPDDLAPKVDEQRRQVEALRQLDSADARPLAEIAARAADDAANYLDQARNNPQQKPAAEAALNRAESAVEKLAEAMQAHEGRPDEQARALAQRQVDSAKSAREQAEANQTPQVGDAARAADQQAAVASELSRVPSGIAEQEKRAAAQAQKSAREAQDRVEQLARQQPSPNPLEPAEASAELAEAMRQNADAQQTAAEALSRFADRLSQPEIAQAASAMNDQAVQNEMAAREPARQELDELAQKAEQLADMQKEAREKTQPLLEGSPNEGERNAQLNAAREAQNKLNGEMWQLSRGADPEARAAAQQHTQFASDALGWDKPERAVAEQQAAEDDLRQLARQARNQSSLLADRAQQASQSPSGQEGGEQSTTGTLAERAQALAERQRSLAQQAADQEKTEPAESLAPGEQARQAVEKQQQIARDAAELAMKAGMTAPDSPAAQKAMEFAKASAEAAEQAAAGAFPQARQQAKSASEQAGEAGKQLEENPLTQGGPQPELAAEAQRLSEQQTENAEDLERLTQSPEARDAAQSQGQKQLEQETKDLSNDLEKVADQLREYPIDRQQQAQQASQARDRGQDAVQSMSQAAQEVEQGNSQAASQQAHRAAEKLRQASRQATNQNPLNEKNPNNPVPNEIGSQVTSARQQLQRAGQSLAQSPSGQGKQGQGQQGQGEQAGKSPGGQSANSSSQQMAKGEGAGEKSGSPGGEAGEGESAQAGEPSASEMLKQGAQALRQAASQLQLRPGSSKNSQMAGQPGQPGEGQKGGQQGGGRGANERPRIVDMQTHLKNLSARNWGQLPGTLQTEILQSTRKRPDGEYARLIRLYFEDISRAQGTPPANREEEAN